MDSSDYWRPWGDYYVSRELGMVMNARGRILQPFFDAANGYEGIVLMVNATRQFVNVHRLVAQAFVPYPQGLPIVDHQDGDKRNNDAANLRWATVPQNQFNRRSSRGSSSRHKGVSFVRRIHRWRATIMANGTRHFLGHFDDEDDAGRAYDAAARLLHGPFVRLNLPRAD